MAERSISQLIADISADSKALAEEEAALAKSEVTAGAKKLGIGGGLAIGALLVLFFAVFMGLFAAVAGLAEGAGLPWWASFLIVFGVMMLIVIVLIAVAIPLLKKGNPTPTRAIEGGKSAVAALTRAVKNPGGPRT